MDTGVHDEKIIGSLLILPILLWMTVPVALAAGSAVSAMSEIVMHLQHYPSSNEKGVLSKIAQNDTATVGEKLLAGALIRMQHAVQGADVVALRALVANKQASHSERELADILLAIKHKPSSSDLKRLKLLSET